MNATSTEPANGGGQFRQPILRTDSDSRATTQLAGNFVRATEQSPRRVGYGLPCSKCGTYYTADQPVCPICKSGERVSPATVAVLTHREGIRSLPTPDKWGQKREHTPKAFRSQLASAPAVSSCSFDDKHQADHEPASVCQCCYDSLQERVDVLEAALEIDLNEAAKIVYDAVWSDPSDPVKTYQNAARALLAELRMRSDTTAQPRGRGLAMRQPSRVPEKDRRLRCKVLLRSQERATPGNFGDDPSRLTRAS